MITVGIYIKDAVTLEYNRVELFDDEKISVNSSIQNVNDISKTFTDFSKTFTVPATKQNNKIFKHWYENSLDIGFSTLVKSDAYIELDTIPFRTGKIQLETANIKDGQPQHYSITFIGALGTLKDKFAGLFLKDLDSSFYDIAYTPTIVKDKVTTTTTSADVMFPLISSSRYWNYGAGGDEDINLNHRPIRYNELFPAIKLRAVFDMIDRDSKWNINFNGSFLNDARFTSAYLWLKNAETFVAKSSPSLITYDSVAPGGGWTVNLTNETFKYDGSIPNWLYFDCKINITLTVAAIDYKVHTYKNGIEIGVQTATSTGLNQTFTIPGDFSQGDVFSMYISSLLPITFGSFLDLNIIEPDGMGGEITYSTTVNKSANQTVSNTTLSPKNYFPEIKIEDFFSGILKMFNLTCYSTDGINYTIEQLESYYTSGTIRDITKYIKSDSIALNRVKTYKKINFEYEKSESIVNVGFKSANNIEYGSLFYDTGNDGEEYNIKLPFEDLNFNNLSGLLQVGYALKSDLQKYTPKPIILYDYKPTALTTAPTFHFATALTGNGSAYTTYKAFGQEFFNGTDTFSLNFNEQQSTLTNQLVSNSLYNQYYQNYLLNIFDFKARLIKVSGILPTSLLTSLKLNDRLIIRDKRYLVNTFTTDLTTGEVSFELLTDFRAL